MTSKTILLIDNKPNYENFHLAINVESNHKIIYATSIKKIISTLFSQSIDIIILDADFHLIGGFKILEIIRRHKQTKNIPLIILTSTLSEKNIKLSYSKGANLCLGKPVFINDIILSINCLLESKLKKVV